MIPVTILTEKEVERLHELDEFDEMDVIHEFSRRSEYPPWMEIAVEITQHADNKYCPAVSITLAAFLHLMVRSGRLTNEQVRELFRDPGDAWDLSQPEPIVSSTKERKPEGDRPDWPSFNREPENWAKLARWLGKSGVQRYTWDGRDGIELSWHNGFVQAD